MRTLCLCALLLFAASVLAQTPGDIPPSKTQPQWQIFRAPDGTFQFRGLDGKAKKFDSSAPGSDTCYYIRSYVMRRDDDNTDAMHLERVTTCTPNPRVRVRSTVRVVPAVR